MPFEVDMTMAKCSFCDDGEAEESTAHIMAQCDSFAALRQRIFGNGYLNLEDFALNKAAKIIEFLKEANIPIFNDILNYTPDI